MTRVYYTESKIHGFGLFTVDNLKVGDLIGVSHVTYEGRWFVVLPIGLFYNHSPNPNCIVKTEGNINLVTAKKDIKIGEELVVDYRLQPYLEQPKDGWKNN